jgi:hypothetical protein
MSKLDQEVKSLTEELSRVLKAHSQSQGINAISEVLEPFIKHARSIKVEFGAAALDSMNPVLEQALSAANSVSHNRAAELRYIMGVAEPTKH